MRAARLLDQQLAMIDAQLALAEAARASGAVSERSVKQACLLQLALALDLYACELSDVSSPSCDGAFAALLAQSPNQGDFRHQELLFAYQHPGHWLQSLLQLFSSLTICETPKSGVVSPSLIASSGDASVGSVSWPALSLENLEGYCEEFKSMVLRHREGSLEN